VFLNGIKSPAIDCSRKGNFKEVNIEYLSQVSLAMPFQPSIGHGAGVPGIPFILKVYGNNE